MAQGKLETKTVIAGMTVDMPADLAVRTLRHMVKTARAEYDSIRNTRAGMRPSEQAMALANRAEQVAALEMGASAIEAFAKTTTIVHPAKR